MIRQNDVCAGALNAGEDFESGAFFIEPAVLRGRFDHGVFAADVVSSDRNEEFLPDPHDDIEIPPPGFDHAHDQTRVAVSRYHPDRKITRLNSSHQLISY